MIVTSWTDMANISNLHKYYDHNIKRYYYYVDLFAPTIDFIVSSPRRISFIPAEQTRINLTLQQYAGAVRSYHYTDCYLLSILFRIVQRSRVIMLVHTDLWLG